MKNVAITGLNGVIGNILAKELEDVNISSLYNNKKSTGKNIKNKKLDLLNTNLINKTLYSVEPDIIIHLAAQTHIDKCESDKKNSKNGIVWKINVNATKEIALFAAENKIPLIYLSTECVFDGGKEAYSEKDRKHPKSWYGITKSEAEDLILNIGGKSSIIRSVVAYHKRDRRKTIHGKLLNQLNTCEVVNVVSDQKFTPTYTYDIIKVIKKILDNDLEGIFHVAPELISTPYDLARLIAIRNNYKNSKVKRTTMKKLLGEERASLRLKNAVLNSKSTIKTLGFKPKNIYEII